MYKKGFEMLMEKISDLREILNNITKTESLSSATVIKTSHEMDNLIMQYYDSWEKSLQK